VIQALVAVTLGFGEFQRGWIFLAISAVLYLWSLWFFGSYWDRSTRRSPIA
jgi:hypothetical protein